jgi:hypothetical protein
MLRIGLSRTAFGAVAVAAALVISAPAAAWILPTAVLSAALTPPQPPDPPQPPPPEAEPTGDDAGPLLALGDDDADGPTLNVPVPPERPRLGERSRLRFRQNPAGSAPQAPVPPVPPMRPAPPGAADGVTPAHRGGTPQGDGSEACPSQRPERHRWGVPQGRPAGPGQFGQRPPQHAADPWPAIALALKNMDDLVTFYEQQQRPQDAERVLKQRIELPLRLAEARMVGREVGPVAGLSAYFRGAGHPERAEALEQTILDRALERLDVASATLNARREGLERRRARLEERAGEAREHRERQQAEPGPASVPAEGGRQGRLGFGDRARPETATGPEAGARPAREGAPPFAPRAGRAVRPPQAELEALQTEQQELTERLQEVQARIEKRLEQISQRIEALTDQMQGAPEAPQPPEGAPPAAGAPAAKPDKKLRAPKAAPREGDRPPGPGGV